jgi:hypothetical protein
LRHLPAADVITVNLAKVVTISSAQIITITLWKAVDVKTADVEVAEAAADS